ncbi:MAG: hypothetical protein VW877_17145 [Pseudomonadaceae bacterium]
MNMLRRFSILQRLISVTVLALVIVLGLMTAFAIDYRNSLLDGRAMKTQHLVESGLGVIQYYYQLQQNGELSEQQAQQQVENSRSALQSIAESVDTITDMTSQVAAAAEQQSRTSTEISASLSQLSNLGDRVLRELQGTEVNTRELSKLAQQLEQLIGQFKTSRS